MGGFSQTVTDMLATPSQAPLLTRERHSPLYFFSYMFIPFSAIAFPHIGIFCLTAKRLSHFKHTAIAYPLCLMAIWLPSTILGVVANRASDVPAIERKSRHASYWPRLAHRSRRTAAGAPAPGGWRRRRDPAAALLRAGVAGGPARRGIMAAVMSSDSQILALSTMFTEDVFAHYGGKRRYRESAGEAGSRVRDPGDAGRLRRGVVGASQHLSRSRRSTGFRLRGSLADGVAALFWKRSTKWGALAVTLWAAGSVAATAVFQSAVAAPPPGQSLSVLSVGGWDLVSRTGTGTAVLGFAPVMPMVLISVALMWAVSTVTRPPSAATIARYNV